MLTSEFVTSVRRQGSIPSTVTDVTILAMGDEEIHALRGVSISIERGEYVAIMGPSGAGKSSLLAICGGLRRTSSGSVTVGGVNLGDLIFTNESNNFGWVIEKKPKTFVLKRPDGGPFLGFTAITSTKESTS